MKNLIEKIKKLFRKEKEIRSCDFCKSSPAETVIWGSLYPFFARFEIYACETCKRIIKDKIKEIRKRIVEKNIQEIKDLFF